MVYNDAMRVPPRGPVTLRDLAATPAGPAS
jgi:hypothetical protein